MSGFWLFVLLLAVVALLIALGYWLAKDKLAEEQHDLDVARDVLRAEWSALEGSRQINDVFFQARDAMRRTEGEAGGRGWQHPHIVDGEWKES